MLADEVLEYLAKVTRFIDEKGDMIFYLKDMDAAMKVKGLLNQWYFDREGYSPWIQDGDHWDHVHPDGINVHHFSKGCPELS